MLKLNFAQIARLQIIVLITAIILILGISANFLYKNFYKTLASTEEIMVLRNQIALEQVNVNLFNQVTKAIENKKAAPKVDWTTFKNPFLPYSVDEIEE